MFRLFQHLLPRALAWRTTVATNLRRYLEGLAAFAADVRGFIDLVYLDLFPSTTRELALWEFHFALASTGTEAARRLRLAGAWASQGGQSPDYLQSVVHAAGFTSVFIHEWWESTDPFVARDPRLYTTPPLLGTYQCEDTTPWECFEPGPGDPLAAHCEDTLANEPGYLVNQDLTRRAPPGVPSDPARWPYFLYFGHKYFPLLAPLHADQRRDLEALLLRICPAQQWIVTLLAIPPLIDNLLYQFAADDADTEYEPGTEDDLRRLASVPNQGSLGGATVQATSGARPVTSTFRHGRVAYFGDSKSMASSLPASAWTALHDGTSNVTIALRLYLLDPGTSVLILDTYGADSGPGASLLYSSGNLSYLITDGMTFATVEAAISVGEEHDVLIVKSGDELALYIDDMSTPVDSATVSSPSASAPGQTLTIGKTPAAFAFNSWLAEVLVYDVAAGEEQRDAIASYLSRHASFEPTLEEYVEYMAEDGLAHLFTPESIVGSVTAWTDLVTETDMTFTGPGGGATLDTLDGVNAVVLDEMQGEFDAASEIADGSSSFTIYLYASLQESFFAPEDNVPTWAFTHSVGTDRHLQAAFDITSETRIVRNGESSASLTFSAGREYTHIFRAAGDAANLYRIPGSETSPALNVPSIQVDRFRIHGIDAPSTYAIIALFSRALSEGDLIVLHQLIEREILP